MTIASTWRMYTKSPPAPGYAPYFGRWPIMTVTTSLGTSSFEFAWSSFDVWPELLAGVEARRISRESQS